jgi:hypothetical protein
MVVSKLNLVILAAAAGGVAWIEHTHRITIAMRPPAKVAVASTPACPENESVPFSADCMRYIQGGAGSEVHPRLNAVDAALPDSPELP